MAAAKSPGSTRALVALLAFLLGFATVPHRVMEREAPRWFEGAPGQAAALAAGVARWTRDPGAIAPASFATGSRRFDHEWFFGTFMMAAMGFGQTAAAAPDEARRAEALARMERCLDVILDDPRARAFDAEGWAEDPLASVAAPAGSREDRGHLAYLAYAALPLALHRTLAPASRFAGREGAIVAALARRIEASPTGLAETYPGEVYPVDNAAVAAALALDARVSPRPAPALRRVTGAVARSVDRETGLLFQAVALADASPRDRPRASGTALAAYFLSYADVALSRALFLALERSQYRTVLGFGGVLEYPRTAGAAPRGDVDSGPVVLGFGVSASGFALGASRVHGERDMFTALYATAQLFGAPLEESGARTYATGGPIGDAILFAMLTAPRASAGSP
jgi:hypothetical protein